jgi:hypothetical protein
MKTRVFKSYDEAKIFVHSLNLKNSDEWAVYRRSGNKPRDIPSNPHIQYKNSGWISMGDWLGTGAVAHRCKNFKSFEDARTYVRSLNFEKINDWIIFSKSGKRPQDIPSNPNIFYSEWVSFHDWIGVEKLSMASRCNRRYNLIYNRFIDARNYVWSLNLKTKRAWKEYCISGKKPKNIPFHPNVSYKHRGWVSWDNWLKYNIE